MLFTGGEVFRVIFNICKNILKENAVSLKSFKIDLLFITFSIISLIIAYYHDRYTGKYGKIIYDKLLNIDVLCKHSRTAWLFPLFYFLIIQGFFFTMVIEMK
ncbi:MAG: hypothetical protein ACOX3T_02585 [Bdellovibrionota bacterium]